MNLLTILWKNTFFYLVKEHWCHFILSSAYSVFISQLIRYARACPSYECFILKAVRLSSKLLGQGFVKEYLKSSLTKFYGPYGDLIKHYEVSLSQMLHDILGHNHKQWHPQLIRHYTNLWNHYQTLLYNRFWPYNQTSGGFHRTLQRVPIANRGRLLIPTPGRVPFGTCFCSNIETIPSWTRHVYGPFEFRISLDTSICFLYRSSNVSISPAFHELYLTKSKIQSDRFHIIIELSIYG